MSKYILLVAIDCGHAIRYMNDVLNFSQDQIKLRNLLEAGKWKELYPELTQVKFHTVCLRGVHRALVKIYFRCYIFKNISLIRESK